MARAKKQQENSQKTTKKFLDVLLFGFFVFYIQVVLFGLSKMFHLQPLPSSIHMVAERSDSLQRLQVAPRKLSFEARSYNL